MEANDPLLQKYRAYKEHLLSKGHLIAARTVDRCIELARAVPPNRRHWDHEEFGTPELEENKEEKP